MTNYYNDLNSMLLDFEPLAINAVSIEPEQIEQALELSTQVINEERQWQQYLNALALFSFESWLQERIPELSCEQANSSVVQPKYANFIDGVFNLEVGRFKVCLLTNGVMLDEFVTLPRAVLDLPEYIAHFYVVVNIDEEQQESVINSFITYNKLLEHKQSNNLQADSDWTYELPLTCFDSEIDNLLLYLRCLEANAIALPAVPTDRVTALDNIKSQLEFLIPQLRATETALHQILTWEQAVPLLTNPDLLNWLYNLQTTKPSVTDALATLRNQLSATLEGLTQRAINVKAWLSDELDQLSQSLAWTLLPAPAFATAAFRDLHVINRESPIEEFEAIITKLRNSEEEIPVYARGAYQNFNLDTYALRLFAVTWAIEEQENIPEWNLLIILGSQLNSYLPQELKLELQQGDTVLDEKIVERDTEDTYLYTRVIGELDEQFTISITLANGESITFPDFAFQ